MKAQHLTVVRAVRTPTKPEVPLEKQLLKALRAEASLERKLIKARADIGPLKRAYAHRHTTFGLSNEALLRRLTHKD
jgi:hypothetical protein